MGLTVDQTQHKNVFINLNMGYQKISRLKHKDQIIKGIKNILEIVWKHEKL